MNEILLSPAALARRLNVEPETIRGWCRHQKIRCIRLPNGYYRIPVSVLTELLRQINPQNSSQATEQ